MSVALASLLLLLGGTHERGVQWGGDFQKALQVARAQNKPIIVDFWAEWCGWCHRLDRTTYVDPNVVALSQKFVPVKIDTEGSADEVAVAVRYDVLTLPTIAFLSPSGRQLLRVGGYQGPGRFPHTMKKALAIAEKVMGWEEVLARDPGDPGALMKLGVHLFNQDFWDESQELLLKAREADKKHSLDDRKQIRLLLGMTLYSDREYAEAASVLEEGLALGKHPQKDPKLLYVLGRTHSSWGHSKTAIKIMRMILDEHSDSPVAEDAWETLIRLEAHRR